MFMREPFFDLLPYTSEGQNLSIDVEYKVEEHI